MFLVLSQVVTLLSTYEYLVLFPIAVFEGPIITIIAGFLVSQGHMNGALAYSAVVLGDLIGDSLYYAIGRWGKEQFLKRWGKYIGVTPERLQTLTTYFTNHGGKTLSIGKLTHGIGAVFLAAAGAAGYPYGKFLWFNFISTLPKSLVLLIIGFYFGKAYESLNQYLDYTAWGVIILSLICAVLYVGVVQKWLAKLSARTKTPL